MSRIAWAGVAAVIAIAAIVGYLRCRSDDHAATPADPAPVSTTTTTPARPAAPPSRVTRVTPEARKQLAERIAAAQAARAASSASSSSATTPRPTLDRPELSAAELEQLKTPILDSLKAIDPLLQACYDKTKPAKPAVKGALFLTGDPDIGAIIDAGELTDDAGQALAKPFEDCLRDVLSQIELPPLREGDKVQVTYVFDFADHK